MSVCATIVDMGYNEADVKALGNMCAQVKGLQNAIERQVAFLREQGTPWSVIADALDMTRQGAQQRYGKPAATPDAGTQ